MKQINFKYLIIVFTHELALLFIIIIKKKKTCFINKNNTNYIILIIFYDRELRLNLNIEKI
jgi:hypothetical protein